MSTEIKDEQYSLFSTFPQLTLDERDDARFRGKDLAWSVLSGLYDEIAEGDDTLSYASLGDRVGLKRSQVQRWMDSPHNMTFQSFALLAEGLDAEIILKLVRRRLPQLSNVCHPADEARANANLRYYLESATPRLASANDASAVQGW